MIGESTKDYLAQIGSKGGKAGKGAAKRRDPEHYRTISQLAAKSRAKKAKRAKK
jgi:hypothetical protein